MLENKRKFECFIKYLLSDDHGSGTKEDNDTKTKD